MKLQIFIKRFFETRKHFEKRVNKFLQTISNVINVDKMYYKYAYLVYYNEDVDKK